MATVKKAKTNPVPTSAQNQINKQIAESKAKAEQARTDAMANANSKGSTSSSQTAQAYESAFQATPASTASATPATENTAIANQGTTKTGVDQMTAADRAWDSLNYSYGKKIEESNKQYDRAIAQTDRQALSRGMQRSSYNNQTLANMREDQVKAANDIYDQQIAAYENQLYQIERDQVADEQWEKSFGYQQQSDQQKIAYNFAASMIQQGKMPSDELLAQAGLSKADVSMLVESENKNKSGGGTPYWASLGFYSEKDYADARQKGMTRNATEYNAKKYGTGETKKSDTSSGLLSYDQLIKAANGVSAAAVNPDIAKQVVKKNIGND